MRQSLARLFLALLVASVLLSACDLLLETPTPATGSGTPGPLPDMPQKPEPQVGTFNGCPPEGDGGDPALNRLKNRVDEGNYVPVLFSAIMALTWPKEIERRDRANWPAGDAAEIARYEGIPVVVEGYLYGGKESGPESTNCHGSDNDNVDWHVWFTETAGEDRTRSIVVEPTPRTRVNHHWTLKQITQIAQDQLKVRISGWLFFDPEHPDQIGQTRGTIWEIHPVMQFEVNQNGRWMALDDWSGQ